MYSCIVKMYKNTWLPLLSLLLVFLQPLVSFGNVPHLSSEIVNTQEELALFKTKSSKALVFQEIEIHSSEQVISSDSFFNSSILECIYSKQNPRFSTSFDYLIDLRSVVASQIFPFHFFF